MSLDERLKFAQMKARHSKMLKPWFKKWWGILIIIIVVLLILIDLNYLINLFIISFNILI